MATNKPVERVAADGCFRQLRMRLAAAIAHFFRWEKGHLMLLPHNPKRKRISALAVWILLSVLVTSCSSPRSSTSSHSQALGDLVVTLDRYTQNAGSGWQAVILATNASSMKLECV